MRTGDLVGGRFALERLAAAGGMGDVYRARDAQTGETVALKRQRRDVESALARFGREMRLVAELSDPGIVRFVAAGVSEEGEPYLVTEWLEGEDLAKRLSRGALKVDETLALGAAVSRALGVVHARGIVHRDIKPGNVFLVGGDIERVKILDFGIAHTRLAQRFSEGLTLPGSVIGSAGYMAPEQARGEQTIDARTDVFGLGCVLFRCLAGVPPFPGTDVLAVLIKLVLEDAPPIESLRPGLEPAICALIRRMLSKDPDRRPRDGAAVNAALVAIAAHAANTASWGPPGITSRERRAVCVVLAGAYAPFDEEPTEVDSPSEPARSDDLDSLLRDDIRALDLELLALQDGSLLVPVPSAGPFIDQATRAARAALAIRARKDGIPIVVVSGRSEVEGPAPLGEVIERSVAALRSVERAASRAIAVEGSIASMLDGTFEFAPHALGGDLLRERDASAARDVLGKRTPFLGRDRELALLDTYFAAAVEEQSARAVKILAPPGLGKTRLVREFLERASSSEHAPAVWLARGDSMYAGSPNATIARALRRAMRVEEAAASARDQVHAFASVRLHDDVKTIAGDLAELVGVSAAADDTDPDASAADRTRRAVEELAAAECESRPLVIVFDDFQWADAASVACLDQLLRNLADRPILAVLLGRPDADQKHPSALAHRAVTSITLGPLPKRACEELARHVLGDTLGAASLERLVSRAAGNAFYVEELARAVAHGRSTALPDTVVAMAEARLADLDPRARRVLRAASVFGGSFSARGVRVLLAGEDAREALAALVDEGILRVEASGDERGYGFQQSLHREAAYAALTPEDRSLGHRLAGEWLEQTGSRDAAVLADHFARSGEPARAERHYRAAADQALRASDIAGALDWAAKGVACGGAAEDVAHLRLIQAEAHRWLGDFAAAWEAACDARARATAGSATWWAATGRSALTAGTRGDTNALVSLAETAAVAWSNDGPEERIQALASLATCLHLAGESTWRNALALRLDAVSTIGSSAATRARLHQLAAHRSEDEPERYLGEIRAAVACFVEAGSLRFEASARGALGFGWIQVGRWTDAEHELDLAIRIAGRLGLAMVVAQAKHNLGTVYARLGRRAEAEAVITESFDWFHTHGAPRLAVGCLVDLARLRLEEGDIAGADDNLTRAREISQRFFDLQARYALARVRLAEGRADEAVNLAREGPMPGGAAEGEALLVLAEAHAATGRDDDAREMIRRARDRLLTRAASIADADVCASFLAIPEHARTLQLAKAW